MKISEVSSVKKNNENDSDFSTISIKKEIHDEEEDNYGDDTVVEDDLEALKKETETSDGNKIYYCKKCDQTFKKQASLDGHILRTHGEEADPETDNLLKESISIVMDEGMKKFSCNICNNLFTKKQSAKSHIITIHQGRKDYICSQCNKALGSSSSLLKHIRAVHEGQKAYACDLCEKKYAYLGELKQHKLKIHGLSLEEQRTQKHNLFIGIKETWGDEDDTQDSNEPSSLNNVVVEKTEKNFECGYCKIFYKNLENLEEHQEQMHKGHSAKTIVHEGDKKKFSCELCGNLFTAKQSLRAHINNVHEKRRDHVCPHCNKGIASKKSLRDHIAAVHDGQKNHICDHW